MSDAMGNLTFTATYDLLSTDLLFDGLFGVEHEPEDLIPLMTRVFVIHGMNAGPGGNGFEVTANTQRGEYVTLLPAAAGELVAVPEPAALGILGLGVLGIAGLRRRKAT